MRVLQLFLLLLMNLDRNTVAKNKGNTGVGKGWIGSGAGRRGNYVSAVTGAVCAVGPRYAPFSTRGANASELAETPCH